MSRLSSEPHGIRLASTNKADHIEGRPHVVPERTEIAKQVWVMRSGQLVGGRRTNETSGTELVAMITGASEEQIAREE